jgi:multidrug efflux pump
MRTVRLALRHPGTTLALAAGLLVLVQLAYGKFGRGVEFFPNVEPDYGQVIVNARGNLSLKEKIGSSAKSSAACSSLTG